MPSDEVYEKAVNMATVVYQLEGEGEKTQFVPIHENSAKMLQVSILHPSRVRVFNNMFPGKSAWSNIPMLFLGILFLS